MRGGLLAAAMLVVCTTAMGGGDEMRTRPIPPRRGGNSFYQANRPPLRPSALIKLPVGAVKPRGWLAKQLQLMADGFTGRLEELSPWLDYKTSAWANPAGEGERGWEELPYWLRGFTSLAYVLGDGRLIEKARRWLEPIIASQREDGWFGPLSNLRAHDLWPNMIALYALRTHFEATGDRRVIELMLRFCRFLQRLPFEHFLPGSWQKWRGGDLLDHVLWLYNVTGEQWLVDLARIVHDRTADWAGHFPNWHGVNISQCFREPAQYWLVSTDDRYLRASEYVYDTVMRIYGQVPGGMFGADENCRRFYTGPQQAAETCSMAEFIHSFSLMLQITGAAKWADRAEDVAFNSLPASMTPDLKALHYLTAPNVVGLDRHNHSPFIQNSGCMLAYNPRLYRCCQHNVAMAWPYFTESLWMATQRNGLAAVIYAPCQVTAKVGDGAEVTIVEDTNYPFGDEVRLRISLDRPADFPLLLRVPGWCDGAWVELNGRRSRLKPRAGEWIYVRRTWRDGDEVVLHLPMQPRIKVWQAQGGAVSVHLGPLAFSLKIAERWQRYEGDDRWPAWEVFAASPWNYGLVVGPNGKAELEVQRSGQVPDQPFTPEAAPVVIKAKGRRIGQWRDIGGIPGPVQPSPAATQSPVEDIVLVPMGCARLRISVFPQVRPDGAGNAWAEEPSGVSWSHLHDCVWAPFDGRVPDGPGDQEVPRFTFWPHRGTTEWIEYRFPEAMQFRAAEVLWFDDGPEGHCRVPKAWRVLYWDGAQWRPVKALGGYPVQMDSICRVEFEPVRAERFRLEVELQPGWSGGLFEWRLIP